MTQYDPLYKWLCSRPAEPVVVTFVKIEELVGFRLPAPARADTGWWANDASAERHQQCRAWMDAGFETGKLDLEDGWVEFVPFT